MIDYSDMSDDRLTDIIKAFFAENAEKHYYPSDISSLFGIDYERTKNIIERLEKDKTIRLSSRPSAYTKEKEHAAHEPEDLVKSQAFAALNLLIDALVREIVWKEQVLKERFAEAQAHHPSIRTRVDYENKSRRGNKTPVAFNSESLKWIREVLSELTSLHEKVDELQRFKLRLLNDYDFTRGDTTEQFAVFGPPSK